MKNSNGVLNTLAVISESFRSIHLTEEGMIGLLDNQMFIHLFEGIPDKRQKGKVVYKLSNLLLMVFLTILDRGKISFTSIADIIEAKQGIYAEHGLIEGENCPSHDTIRRVLSLLDQDALYENTLTGFYMFLRDLEGHVRKRGDYRHIAFDGKEMFMTRRWGRSLNVGLLI